MPAPVLDKPEHDAHKNRQGALAFAMPDSPDAAMPVDAPDPTPAAITFEDHNAPNAAEVKPGIVVFDFDGTLVHGDCGHRYLHWLLRRNPLRLLASAVIAPLVMPLLSLPATRRWAVSVFMWIATVGITQKRLPELAAAFIERYRLRPIASAVEALREEISRGHRVVVATGALQVLADGLLQRMAVREQVELVASESRRFAAGEIVAVQCNGQAKMRHLLAKGFPRPYLRAYSDTWSDRWLLDAAGTPVLVNGNARDRRRLRQRLGQKLRSVLWD